MTSQIGGRDLMVLSQTGPQYLKLEGDHGESYNATVGWDQKASGGS